MATDGVLPPFQQSLTSGARAMEEPNLDIDTLLLTAELQASDDSFLNQFLYGNENVLPGVNDSNFSYDVDQQHLFAPQEPPTLSSPPTSLTPPTSTFSLFHGELDDYPLAGGVHNSPVSSDGYVSDFSSGVKPASPVWAVQGSSMPNSPESLPTVSTTVSGSAQSAGQEDFLDLAQLLQGDFSSSPPNQIPSPTDVHIDLESGSPNSLEDVSKPSLSQQKGSCLQLSDEEKRLLAEEGIVLPTDMVLTKAEEKHLKKVRRKIKNKLSAAESRKRKKEYMDGLEERVERCTEQNRSLQKRVLSLESENRSLLSQLRRLQAVVAQYNPSKVQAASAMLIFILSFSLFFGPKMFSAKQTSLVSYDGSAVRYSRVLLEVETDEFGNLVDPETGQVVSRAGSQSPLPLPPWQLQTPALNLWNSSDLLSNKPHL